MNPDLETPSARPCVFCGGGLAPAFTGVVMESIPVTYFRCGACQSLQLPDPHWLPQAYGQKIVPDPDQGAVNRSTFLHRIIRRLRSRGLRLVPKRGRCLDFGCGRGLLLRLLLDDGHPAWGVDPYPKAVFGEDRVLAAPPDARFDLISCIEVLEHEPAPVAMLRSLAGRLAPEGLLLVSTELHDPGEHGADWWYLDSLQGQHVSFATSEGLKRAAASAGLRWAVSLPLEGRPFVHILHHEDHELSNWKRWLLMRRHRRGESRHRSDRKI